LCFRAGNLLGHVPPGGLVSAPPAWQGCALLLLGLLTAAGAELRWSDGRQQLAGSEHGTLATWALLAGPLTLLVARDLSTSLSGDVPGSARLLHLVTYNYKRSWPTTLDFEAAQWGFGIAATACLVPWLLPRLRRAGALSLAAVGVWFCVFTLWIYLPALAPHFGQRELLLAYYEQRRGPEEPIVAYQMNWKGENFYTGNRLRIFVSTGAKFTKWLKAERQAGTRVMFFLTEHGRVGALKSELGSGYRARALTDKALNDKFALVKVELTSPAP
jgi:hypothetical protein